MRNIGLNLGTVPGMEPKTDIAYLKKAGFDATFAYYFKKGDADTIRNVAVMLDSAGIAFDTVHTPFWGINEIWKDTEAGQSFFEDVQDAVRVAGECGVPTAILHVSSGDCPPAVGRIGIDRFDRLVDLASRLGVTVAFENQRMVYNIAFMMERYRDCPEVGFCWDVGHEHCLSRGWEYMPMFGDRLCALHVHDNPCLHNHDFHMIPGDGSISFAHICRQIKDSGYTGTMMLELMHEPSGAYAEVPHEEYYARAYAAAKRLCEMTDGGGDGEASL